MGKCCIEKCCGGSAAGTCCEEVLWRSELGRSVVKECCRELL